MNIQERIQEILPAINELAKSRYDAGFPENCKEEIVAEVGKKYARLVAFNPARCCVSSFWDYRAGFRFFKKKGLTCLDIELIYSHD